MRVLLGLTLVGAVAAAGCSDGETTPTKQDKGTVKPDKGTKLDLGTTKDQGTLPPDKGTVKPPDKGTTADRAKVDTSKVDQHVGPVSCDPKCTAEAPYLCVPDPADPTSCVECTVTGHCTANPAAFGPTCDTSNGWCTCASSADCANNQHGSVCDTSYGMCGCTASTDCKKAPFTVCDGGDCIQPCATDADCKTASTPKCNTTSGKCVACLLDTDCKAPTPLCHSSGVCGVCKDDVPCATKVEGSKCFDGECGCAVDTDCQGTGSYFFGNKCQQGTTGHGTCGCTADGDCTANPHGPVCSTDYNVCTCTLADNSQCTGTTYTKCSSVVGGLTVNHCAKPCTTAADCSADWLLYTCDVDKCIGCKASTDCAAAEWTKICDTTAKGCVECLLTTDCTTASLGPTCQTTSSGAKYCTCASAAECATNLNGKLCNSEMQQCSCATDTDCPTGRHCTGLAYGVKACKP